MWHHFAVVRGDDKKLQLYIDGSLESSSGEAATGFDDTPFPVILGMNHETNPRYFRGQMDEIRFWNIPRPQEEIISGMNSHIDPGSEGLVAYYDFNRSDEKPDMEKHSEKEANQQYYFSPSVTKALQLPASPNFLHD